MRHMNSRPLIVNVDELAMKLGDFRGRRLEAQQCGDGLLVTDLDEPDLYVRVHSSGVVQPYLKPEEHDCGAGCERAHEACALPRFVLRGCVAYQCNMIARWFILRVGRLRLEWKGGAGALSNAAYPATNEDRWQAVRSWQALLEQAMTDDQTAQPRHFDCRNKHVCRVALALTGEHGYEFLASILGDLVGCTTLSQAFCESADSAETLMRRVVEHLCDSPGMPDHRAHLGYRLLFNIVVRMPAERWPQGEVGKTTLYAMMLVVPWWSGNCIRVRVRMNKIRPVVEAELLSELGTNDTSSPSFSVAAATGFCNSLPGWVSHPW